MAQTDYSIADQTGVSFLSDLNDTLAAIVSNNSGATEPATIYAYQFWADTTAGILKQRNAANDAWINVFTLVGIKASDIRNTPAGNISATTVQAALNELDTEKAALAGATFTGQAKGITPVSDEDLTRKDFVEAAIAAGSDSLTITGSTVFAQSTNNIALTGIGSIGLAVGDVITVTGTSSNNKDFTVEVITDANNIIVNQAHAGGTTTKSLVNQTATSTITLLARGKFAPIGLGQGWVNQTSARSIGVVYTNTLNRPLVIAAFTENTINGFTSIYVSSNEIVKFQHYTTGSTVSVASVVPIDNIYQLVCSKSPTLVKFSELR
jgi:hypothetical protein